MDELNKRVLSVMEHKQMSKSSFALALDTSLPVLTHISSGRNKPGLELIQRLLSRFPDISPDWLILGNGEMYRDTITKPDFEPEIKQFEQMQNELQLQMQYLQQVMDYHQLLFKEISYLSDLDQLLGRNKQGALAIRNKLTELKDSIKSKV
jgi:hypothetical protein